MKLTREQYLLSCLSEECSEITQRISKILRFGLNEIQPLHAQTNKERLINELNDLVGVLELLNEEGMNLDVNRTDIDRKKEKVKKYMKYSEEQGIL